MCFSCYCLFILHALNFVLFLLLLVSGVLCDLCLWHSLDFSINVLFNLQGLPQSKDRSPPPTELIILEALRKRRD